LVDSPIDLFPSIKKHIPSVSIVQEDPKHNYQNKSKPVSLEIQKIKQSPSDLPLFPPQVKQSSRCPTALTASRDVSGSVYWTMTTAMTSWKSKMIHHRHPQTTTHSLAATQRGASTGMLFQICRL